MPKKHPLILSSLLLSSQLLAASGAAAADEPALSVDTMKSVTQELSSDAFEGRAPGTVGEEKTLALLEKECAPFYRGILEHPTKKE